MSTFKVWRLSVHLSSVCVSPVFSNCAGHPRVCTESGRGCCRSGHFKSLDNSWAGVRDYIHWSLDIHGWNMSTQQWSQSQPALWKHPCCAQYSFFLNNVVKVKCVILFPFTGLTIAPLAIIIAIGNRRVPGGGRLGTWMMSTTKWIEPLPLISDTVYLSFVWI